MTYQKCLQASFAKIVFCAFVFFCRSQRWSASNPMKKVPTGVDAINLNEQNFRTGFGKLDTAKKPWVCSQSRNGKTSGVFPVVNFGPCAELQTAPGYHCGVPLRIHPAHSGQSM
jgi:hypothetical protein